MKVILKIVSILMIISTFLLSSFVLFQYSLFKINQNYISENLCIQKDEEVNTCCGSCVLKKEINKENEKNADKVLFSIKDIKVENMIFNRSSNSNYPIVSKVSFFNFQNNQYHFFYNIDIFHPPNSLI